MLENMQILKLYHSNLYRSANQTTAVYSRAYQLIAWMSVAIATPCFRVVSWNCFTCTLRWNETEIKLFHRRTSEISFQFYFSFTADVCPASRVCSRNEISNITIFCAIMPHQLAWSSWLNGLTRETNNSASISAHLQRVTRRLMYRPNSAILLNSQMFNAHIYRGELARVQTRAYRRHSNDGRTLGQNLDSSATELPFRSCRSLIKVINCEPTSNETGYDSHRPPVNDITSRRRPIAAAAAQLKHRWESQLTAPSGRQVPRAEILDRQTGRRTDGRPKLSSQDSNM
jgi:hypothetical protein